MRLPLASLNYHSDLASWLLLAVALSIAWRVTRGGGGAAVTELSAANGVLEKRVRELEGQVRELRQENAVLAARTDFATALAPLLDTAKTHELAAADRFAKTAAVLDAIAERLAA